MDPVSPYVRPSLIAWFYGAVLAIQHEAVLSRAGPWALAALAGATLAGARQSERRRSLGTGKPDERY